jgi:hypothetical protein
MEIMPMKKTIVSDPVLKPSGDNALITIDTVEEGLSGTDKAEQDDNIPVVANIDEVVNHINQIVGENFFETALSVGNYVLEKFFNDDIKEALSRNPHKKHSYRDLQKHEGLKIHFTTLNQMVRIAIQERQLLEKFGEEKVKPLKYSQRVELLSFAEDVKIDMAQKCIDGQLTMVQMRSEIHKSQSVTSIISKYLSKDITSKKFKDLTDEENKTIQERINAYLKKEERTKNDLTIIKQKLEKLLKTKNQAKGKKQEETPV